MPSRWTATLCLSALCACSGASPDPRALAADELPRRELAAAEVEQVAKACDDAQLALIARRFGTAEELARRAIDLDPRAARARAVLGLCLLQRARLHSPSDLFLQNEGEGETLRAVRLAPADPVVGRLRGEFLAQVGHLSAAADAAESVLAAATDGGSRERAALLAAAAEWRYELGEERAALPHLRRLVELRTDDAAAHFRLGFCLLRTATTPAQAGEAAQAFQRCADLSPGDVDAWLAVGRAHLQAAELQGVEGAVREQERTTALAAFTTAVDRFPAAAEPQFCCGAAQLALGRPAEAESRFRSALAKDPNHVAALLELGGQLADAAEPPRRQEGEALLRKALALADGHPGTLSARERQRLDAFLQARAPRRP